jgi:hypothetical protein
LPQEKQEAHAADGEAGGDDLDDDFATGSDSGGESGTDAGSGSNDDSDDEGAGPLQRRRAAGDHELQARLRWGVWRLLNLFSGQGNKCRSLQPRGGVLP